MATEFPWFPFYAADWSLGVSGMTATQRGIYISLLAYQWAHGEVPACQEQCGRIAGASPMADSDWQVVRQKFVVLDGVMRNTRLEEERESCVASKKRRSDAAKKGAEMMWSSKRMATASQPHRNRNADALPMDAQSESESESESHTNPLPPARPAPVDTAARGGGNVNWKPDQGMVDRVAKSNPTVATRLERAEAGDLFVKGPDGQRVAVTPDQVMREARERATEQIQRERQVITQRLTAKGLTATEAHQLWFKMWQEHCEGGPQPTVALANDLADNSIRNHAAVWRARIAG